MNYSRLAAGFFFYLLLTADASPAENRASNPGFEATSEKTAPLCVYGLLEDQRKAREMLSVFVHRSLAKMEDVRKAELTALKRPEDWKARQQRTRARLHEFFGEFPPRTPLNARVVGKLDRERYVIEKVIFESQPGYYCTANFYVPRGRKFPVPGVLFTCGHAAEGKGYHLYHECCLGLVLKGYVVLAFDPMGQGERSEYFDPQTKKPLVNLTVSQHHYIGRPAFLVDWSLSGLRTWDAIRAVDYLVSRPEVDKEKLAATGNSGGGQMGLLITAVDERIKVCVVDHPGGSMENTYLLGQGLIDKEVLSLIPPRPCKIVVGKDSGEEPGHRGKMEDMQLFYEGLGVGKQLGQIEIVHGVHDMKQPKREPGYEWLNKWFGKEEEGKAEPPLQPEKPETLWCTESGFTLVSLGGETGQALNAKRAERIYKPEKDITKLKERIAERLNFRMPSGHDAPHTRLVGVFTTNDFSAEKIVYESEQGIELPALLFSSKKQEADNPVIIHVSDKGKPIKAGQSSLPIALALRGYTVLSVDVRGIGETDSSPPVTLTRYSGYTPPQWRRDCLAIQSPTFKRTMLGMRALDVVRAIDLVKSRDDLKNNRVVLIGEGLGGVWSLAAAVYDLRPASIVCVNTLPSYKLLMSNKYYNVWDYFWVPSALRDYDIPDLVRLIAPRPQLWVDTVDALAERLDREKTSSVIGTHDGPRVIKTDSGSIDEQCSAIAGFVK